MPIVKTQDLKQGENGPFNHQTYCGLDTMITLEVFEELSTLNNRPPEVYSFSRALQAPVLEMTLRGFKVDEYERQSCLAVLRSKREKLNNGLQLLAYAVWNKPLNPRSSKQLLSFFYKVMKLPKVHISVKGERKLSMNRESLEKLEIYLYARPIIACIFAIRDISKQIEFFETELDSDGRFRTSYNIGGTESWRLSSSKSSTGTGGNAQNLKRDDDISKGELSVRKPFIADQGMKLCVFDLEQAESREVGLIFGTLFGDWSYLDACEQGDLHTTTAKMIWPLIVHDRASAEKHFYRHFTYRDMSKRGGHLCLTPDHEVLTPSGWVPISQKPYQIMTFSETESKFDYVSKWTDENYEGDLHSFEGNSISALMTSNHRVPYRADQRHGKIQVRTADQGPGAFMPLGWGYVGGPEKVPARLIAAFMSDGHQNSVNRVSFHMKKERKFERLDYLCKLYGYEYTRNGDKATVIVSNFPKRCNGFMFNWTKECLLDFLDEYKYWDGHISASGQVQLSAVDKDHLEWIQTFGRILGIGGQINKSVVRSTFSGTTKEYITGYYRLGQNIRQYATGKSIKYTKWSTTLRSNAGKDRTSDVIRVLCPTVPSEFFYVRRNGKIFVTGNTSYMGTAWTAARSLKVPLRLMEEFQLAFATGPKAAFPSFPRWWRWTAQQLQTKQQITNSFGVTRTFFGRPNDDATLREAIAHSPQSSTAMRTNLAMWRLWKYMPQVHLLAQTHDSVTFQTRDNHHLADVIKEARKYMSTPIRIGKRVFDVPSDVKVGYNWSAYDAKYNPNGLVKWKGEDTRKRLEGMDRVL